MEITDKSFENEVLKSEIPVLVEFWASWCPPCKVAEPLLEKLGKEFESRVKVAKINVDRNPVTSSKYEIRGLPTFMTFKKGSIFNRCFASKTEDELRQMINEVLK